MAISSEFSLSQTPLSSNTKKKSYLFSEIDAFETSTMQATLSVKATSAENDTLPFTRCFWDMAGILGL